MAEDPPAPDDESEPRGPTAPRGSLASWIESHIWPGWEREAFLAWPAAQPSWESFAAWWREDGMWR